MNETQTPSQDDKVVGALSHATVLLPMWGIVVPVLIWVTQREKSEYIRQQSMQALAWQILQIVLFFVAYIPFMLLILSDVFFTTNEQLEGFFLQFCSIGLIVLITIGPIIVGIYAAVRSLQGQPYTYPLIGQRVRAYLAK